MTPSVKQKSSASKEVVAVAPPRWQEVRQGLLLAVAGYFCLLLLGAPAPLFFSAYGEDVAMDIGLRAEDAVDVAWLSLGVAGILGYGLVLAGQWRCLVYAPQSHGAREILFAGLLCTLIAPVAFAASLAFRGSGGADLFQLVAGVLVLLSVLLFTAFGQAVRRVLGYNRRRGAVAFYWGVAFLAGGTLGAQLLAKLSSHPEARAAVGLCWALCLVWHALLMQRTAQRVAWEVRHPQSRPVTTPPKKGQVTLRAASFLGKEEESPGRGNTPAEIVDALFAPPSADLPEK